MCSVCGCVVLYVCELDKYSSVKELSSSMNFWYSVSPPPGCPDPTVAPSATTTSHPSTDKMSPTETIINPINTNKPVKPTSSSQSSGMLIKISVFQIGRHDLYCFL